jgi:hypothetical protein
MPAVIARSHCSLASTTPSPQTTKQSVSVAAVQPAGQQWSPPTQALIGVATQSELQVLGDPTKVSLVQSFGAAWQAVGHEPATALSQVSTGGSTTPSPHTAAQSASTVRSPPGGQQPSPATKAVTGRWTQLAAQVPPESSRSVVQGLPSSQAVGQAPGLPAGIATSQLSSIWTLPSPQVAEQSGSVAAVHPAGQQPSLCGLQAAIGLETQVAVQALVEPVSAVCTQADGDGGQLVGQAPGPTAALSHDSPGSTTPSPQRAGQSVSVALVPPSGQLPSPEVGVVIEVWAHFTVQPLPTRKSLV